MSVCLVRSDCAGVRSGGPGIRLRAGSTLNEPALVLCTGHSILHKHPASFLSTHAQTRIQYPHTGLVLLRKKNCVITLIVPHCALYGNVLQPNKNLRMWMQ